LLCAGSLAAVLLERSLAPAPRFPEGVTTAPFNRDTRPSDLAAAFSAKFQDYRQTLHQVEKPEHSYSRAELKALAAGVAEEVGIDARLFDALIVTESDYQVGAVSPKAAMSLTQLMPATAAELGLSPDEYFDPLANMRGGAKYLRSLIDQTDDVAIALAGYNYGPARAKTRTPDAWPQETRRYVDLVLRRAGMTSGYLRLHAGSSRFREGGVASIVSMAEAPARAAETNAPTDDGEEADALAVNPDFEALKAAFRQQTKGSGT
ncbi:MAG: lytic transglycosylase domain-containing protein, partial [Pseudomonadota bacterium]